MGKSSGWFRRIFGGKKSVNSLSGSGRSDTNSSKEKKKWGFNKSHNTDNTAAPQFAANKGDVSSSSYVGETIDANKHAIAVAAATAAVAEAAVAAARAAAEVVRLTSGGGRSTPTAYVNESRRYGEILAAIKIQSAFRGYLAKRALKALKGLVKLQALVRGHIVRKQTADMLRRMHALVRVQARARASRALMSEYSYGRNKSFLLNHLDPASPDKYKHQLRANSTKFDQSSVLKRCGSNSRIRDTGLDKACLGSNWLDRWKEECSWNNQRDRSPKTYANDEKFDKILEVDTWKPHLNSKGSNRTFQTSQLYNNQTYMTFDSLSKYTTKAQKSNPTSGEVSSLSSLKFPVEVNEPTLWTAENSPQMLSASSMPGSSARRGPFTPTRREFLQSFYSGYSNHPNYMANTESYRAKVRSQSAPKQRIEFEKSFSTRSVYGFPDSGTNSHLRSAALHGLSSLR